MPDERKPKMVAAGGYGNCGSGSVFEGEMMSIQYRDGSFSETMPYNEIMELFKQDTEKGAEIKALHFGTFKEIEAEKEKLAIEDRVKQLEMAVKELSPVKTILEIPTPEEVRKFAMDEQAAKEIFLNNK